MVTRRTRVTAIAIGSLVGVVAIAAASSTILIAHGDTHKSSTAASAQRTSGNVVQTSSKPGSNNAGSAGDTTDQQSGRPFLGITLSDSNGKLTVQSVVAGGPAATAGVNQGDVITAIDGTTIASTADLKKALAGKKPGDSITLSVDRGGNKQDLKVTLGSTPQRQNSSANATNGRGFLGVSVQNVDDAAKQKFSLNTSDGALITQVQSGGPADKAGLKAGDLITSVNGTQIKNVTDLTSAFQNTKSGDTATVQYQRAGSSQSASVTLGNGPSAGNGNPRFGSNGGMNGPALPNIGAALGKNFDRFISSVTKTKDDNGATHTDTTVGGTVKSAAANNQVTVTLNGGGEQTFTIDSNTKIRKGFRGSGAASDLAANDKVLVTTRDGSNTATTILVVDPNGIGGILSGAAEDGGSANDPAGSGGSQAGPSNGGIHIRIPGGPDITVPSPGRNGQPKSNRGGTF